MKLWLSSPKTETPMQLFLLPHLSPEMVHQQRVAFSFDENESRHITRSLRLKTGDTVRITDGAGYLYNGVILEADIRQTTVTISDPQPDKRLLENRLHIAIAPTKNPDRIEWFVEKATEIGIDEITLLECEHSERSKIKTDRLARIAVAALKQSGRSRLPLINEMTTLDRFLQHQYRADKFIAWCETIGENHLLHHIAAGNSAVVMIGPEGDFSLTEARLAIAAGYKPVSLGPFVLRTETAGLASCMMFQQVNRDRS